VKALVVCYSNSGTTRVVAERIAAHLGADLELIEEKKPRPQLVLDGQKAQAGGGALAKAAMAAVFGFGSAIAEPKHSPAEYDIVVVGTPVWAGSLTPAVRSYLKRNRRAFNRVAFFCTAGDPAKLRALSQMRKLARKDPVATVAVKAEEARTDACTGELSAFAARIRSGV